MDFTLQTAYNVAVMFILIGVGYLAFRFGYINYGGAKQLSNILLNIVTPCIILSSFQTDYEESLSSKLLFTALIGVFMFLSGILVGKLAFRRLPYSAQSIYRYSAIVPNCGYMTLPLVYALLGDIGVIYVSVYIAILNFFCWSYGIRLLSGKNKPFSIAKGFLNPGVISVFLAVFMFLFSVKLPPIILDPIKSLASINGPIAMIITGVFMGGSDLLSSIRDKNIYLVIAFRQLLIPGLTAAAMLLIRSLGGPIDTNVFMASMLSSAAPVAVNVSMFAAMCDADVALASKTMVISTLFYTVTISVMVYLSTLALGI